MKYQISFTVETESSADSIRNLLVDCFEGFDIEIKGVPVIQPVWVETVAADSPARALVNSGVRVPRTLEDIEKEAILAALERNGGDNAAAAKELGVSVKTIYNKLNLWAERGKR